MPLSQITGSKFTLRDYISYFFPGLLVIGAAVVLQPTVWTRLKSDRIGLSVVLLVGAYILGFVSHVISSLMVIPVNRIVGDPVRTGVLRSQRRFLAKTLDPNFRKSLIKRLEEVWGQDIINGRESNILFLCWRDIQTKEHRGLEYLFRGISMYNMALNFIFPCCAMAFVFMYKQQYAYALLSIIFAMCMYRGRFVYRREFVRNVYRIWYVFHRESG